MRRRLLTRCIHGAGALLLAGSLAGCALPTDTFNPVIVITSPRAGTVASSGVTEVKGKVLAYGGVRALTVNGHNLFRLPQFAAERGKNIVSFAFKTAGAGGPAAYTIKATDGHGLSSTEVLPIRFRSSRPSLQISRIGRSGKVLQVSGIASDGTEVTQIRVDGTPLPVTPGRRVPFYAQAQGRSMTIEAINAAGRARTVTVH